MLPSLPLALLGGLVLLALTACSGDDAGGSAEIPAADTTGPLPGTAAALGVANAREPLPGLVTAGQVSEEQFDALVAAGYTDFISLRAVGETGAGWEESRDGAGDVAFTRIPVSGAEGLTREAVEELDRRLAAAGEGPTVLYCGSSNRVGALLALRAHWLEGASPEEALEMGRAAGLTGLEPAVRRIMEADGDPDS